MPATALSPPDPWALGGFGVYVHWPYCVSKCPYCDFNSHVAHHVDHGAWRTAYATSLEHWARLTQGQTVTSVFFGGGTPSLMEPDTAAGVIAAIRHLWPCVPDLEITLEANPGTVDADRFAGFRDAGVTRLSLGVQSLHDEALAFLGRAHDAATAVNAVKLARALFGQVSLDLIYARPGQTEAAWRDELRQAVDLGTDHISAYQLTMEPGTPFHRAWERGNLTLPDEDSAVALFDSTESVLRDAGLARYEVSNHARDGAACAHNLGTWRGGMLVPVGPGAHGRLPLHGKLTALALKTAPERWLQSILDDSDAVATRTPLSPEDRVTELMLNGLRLSEGLDTQRFAAQTGITLEQAVNTEALNHLLDERFLVRTATGIACTRDGLRLLDSLLARLLR